MRTMKKIVDDEDDVVMDSDDDDDETSLTYKFTAKMIEIYEGEEKVGTVPWGDIVDEGFSYAGDPLFLSTFQTEVILRNSDTGQWLVQINYLNI